MHGYRRVALWSLMKYKNAARQSRLKKKIYSKRWLLIAFKLEHFRWKIFSLWKSSRGFQGIQGWVLQPPLRQDHGWIPVFLKPSGLFLREAGCCNATLGWLHCIVGNTVQLETGGKNTQILQGPCKPKVFQGQRSEWSAGVNHSCNDSWAIVCGLQGPPKRWMWLVWFAGVVSEVAQPYMKEDSLSCSSCSLFHCFTPRNNLVTHNSFWS